MRQQRQIFWFWLPLALSWLMMTIEGPWVQAVIGRKPDADLQLAAFGLVFSLAVTIEAPVIMLLATGAALAKHRQAYQLLLRYTLFLNILITIVSVLMGFTPLLDWWVGGVLNVSQDIVDAMRPAMRLMVVWPAFIGIRRFYQGIIIRNQHTKHIGYGTLVRIIFSAGIAVALGIWTGFSGVEIGGIALAISITAEMLYILWAARPDVATLLKTEPSPEEVELTYRAAIRFHLPLALTSFMTLLVRPVIEAGLARSPEPIVALAAWPVVFGILLVMRSGGMSYQEVVIALGKSKQDIDALRRFAWLLGITATGSFLLVSFTPLITLYLDTVLSIPAHLHHSVILGCQVGILIPLLTVLQSYLRGLLMLNDNTSPIYIAMMLSFGLTALVMIFGTITNINGILAGTLGLTVGLVAEMAVLYFALKRGSASSKFTLATTNASGD